ncbi:MAG: chemotaxis protein CheA [Firmicutes bacterium]|jgi:two-component system chemotaxis sensor kinase CheA|nr:chemotaxis protein CheA [Bacillota bacterium]
MDFYEYKDVFAVEAREHIQSLNENLLQFEQTPADRELVAEMFRAAHSLKGMAGTMGYTQLADFTHHMENLLDALRNEEIAPSQELINTLFDSVDMLELILEEVISFDTVHTDTTAMKERLAEILAGSLAQPKAAEAAEAGQAEPIPSRQAGEAEVQLTLNEYDRELLKEAAARNYNVYWITVIIRQDVLMKSVRAYTVFQALEKLGTVVKSEPSAEDIDEEHFEDRFAVLIFTRQSLPEVREAILNIPEILDVIVSEVTVEDAESLPPRTPEITAGKERADQAVRRAGDGRSRVVEKYVRVETERLDQLNNLVGELVISRTQVMELAKQLEDGHSRAVIAQMDRVTTELQYAAMKLRMVPVKHVFDRFPRMVRDLAKQAGKDVQLQIAGEETELDRSLTNQIGDPLVHLIRNAVDHGLEAREERLRAGKPAEGRIRLEARHEGSHVVIEVADDGRGIDSEKVKAKAVDIGLITLEQAAKMTPQEAQGLIFEPGFSTSEEVTDVSGRGVGMDAVKAILEAMNGSVELRSTLGKGTTVSLRLPLTLAIIQALLVRTGTEMLAIPIQSVRENLRVTPEVVKTIHGERVITLRNEVLPILDLTGLLGFGTITHDGGMPVIVVEAGTMKAGLMVDELLGQQEVVIKRLSPILGDVKGLAGATVLGDGTVALILDVAAVLNDLTAESK